ncbi:MAG: hypothetical protein M9887_00965 [Chitinophagales bacterium]|nr:hypothetical protein [Chitinophagales bacterium]
MTLKVLIINDLDSLCFKANAIRKKTTQDISTSIGMIKNSWKLNYIFNTIKFNHQFKWEIGGETLILSTTLPILNGIEPDMSRTIDLEGIKIACHIAKYIACIREIPFMMFSSPIGVSRKTIPVIIYLLQNGIPPKFIHKLLQSPIVLDYINYRDMAEGVIARSLNNTSDMDIFKNYLTRSGLNKLDLYSLIDILQLNAYSSNITIEMLDDSIEKEHVNTYNLNAAKILRAFLIIERQANIYGELVRALSFETKLYKNLEDYKFNVERLNEVIDTDLFDKESIQELLSGSLFKQAKKSADLYYYPWVDLFLSKREVGINIKAAIKSMAFKLSPSSIKYRNIIAHAMENQFPLFLIRILRDFVTRDAKLTQKEILLTDIDSSIVGDFLVVALRSFKSMYNITTLNMIYPERLGDRYGFSINIPTNFADDLNLYLRDMISFIHGDKSVTVQVGQKEFVLSPLKFIYQLAAYNMFQTKNSTSTHDLTKILPSKIKVDIMEVVTKSYLQLEEKIMGDPDKVKTFIHEFGLLFLANNHNYISYNPQSTLSLEYVSNTNERVVVLRANNKINYFEKKKGNVGAFYYMDNEYLSASEDMNMISSIDAFSKEYVIPDTLNGKFYLASSPGVTYSINQRLVMLKVDNGGNGVMKLKGCSSYIAHIRDYIIEPIIIKGAFNTEA